MGILANASAQKYHEEIKDKMNYEPNRRDHLDGGSNRNEWTQFEYGYIAGLMKVDLPSD